MDSFTIPEMIDPATNSGFILKPGSPCTGTLGYCDIFSKCRSVDGEGPLARLKNFILNPVTLSTIRTWVTVSCPSYITCFLPHRPIHRFIFPRPTGGQPC